MNINLNVKIKAGPRTVTEVTVYSTSVNEKSLELKNGKIITEHEIVEYLQMELTSMLLAE